MSLLKGKGRKEAAKKQDGKKFLAEARQDHTALFVEYAERADEDYDDIAELLTDVESDAWELTEKVVKKSFFNGLTAGGRRKSRN